MPLYNFKCDMCANIFELMLPMTESNSSPDCPACQCFNTQRHYDSGLMAIPPDRLGRCKVPEGFKEVLKNIATRTVGNHGLESRL